MYRVFYHIPATSEILVEDFKEVGPANKLVERVQEQESGRWFAYEKADHTNHEWQFISSNSSRSLKADIEKGFFDIVYKKKTCVCGEVICQDTVACSRNCTIALAA